MSDQIKNVSDASFEADVLKSGQPVLVDYWAAWCGPCKMIAPILEEVAAEYAGRLTVAKLNVDDNQGTAAKYGIRGIPTLMLFRTARPPPPRSARCRSRNLPHSWTARCKLRAVTEARRPGGGVLQRNTREPVRGAPTNPPLHSPPLTAMHLNELKALHVSQLLEMAAGLEIENANRLRKQELMFAIMKRRAKQGEQIFGDGVLEVLPDGFGFLRSPETSYLASTDDIYISPSQIRRFNLHTGDSIEGEVRTPKDGERYFALVKVDKVNGVAPEAIKHRIMFENLTPLHPNRTMRLERDIKSEENLTGRILDVFAPIGMGQRGLIVASPKSGKTVMMQHIAHAITTNYPDAVMIVLLVDERPEEVTEMQRTVRGEVVASTFDEPATRHVQVAEMVIEKAKRLVEMKRTW